MANRSDSDYIFEAYEKANMINVGEIRVDIVKHLKYNPTYKKYWNRACKLAKYILSLHHYNKHFKLLDLGDKEWKIVVLLRPLRQKGNNGRIWNSRILDDNKIIYIEIDPRFALDTTICHEFVHVEQVVKGKLSHKIVDYEYVPFWMGQMVSRKEVAYRDLPWEKEAFGREKELARNFDKIIP